MELRGDKKMFKANINKDIAKHYKNTDIISVRANKNGLQWCLFEDTGLGYGIENEGCEHIGEVLHFRIKNSPNPVSVEDLTDIIFDFQFPLAKNLYPDRGGEVGKAAIKQHSYNLAQALFDRIYGKK
jgi:hypothetical protein